MTDRDGKRAGIRVLAVDDSVLVREFIRQTLSAQPWVEAVETAPDPIYARDRMATFKPDVLTLDIEMPRLDGLSFLAEVMAKNPLPVVMFSAFTQNGAAATIEALAKGAVDFITKPTTNLSTDLPGLAAEVAAKVKAAAGARLFTLGAAGGGSMTAIPAGPANRVVLIGASTGGTTAIETILRDLDRDCPPLAVVQHMPEKFTRAFAERLDSNCSIRVSEALSGQILEKGQALIGPGGRHMLIQTTSPGRWRVEIKDGPPVNRHKPSVDVLFRSAANAAGRCAVGVLLTGMGSDGANGLLEIRRAGGLTAAQDEATSVIYGMPRAAAQLGAANVVLPLEDISGLIKGRS